MLFWRYIINQTSQKDFNRKKEKKKHENKNIYMFKYSAEGSAQAQLRA